MLNWPKLCLRLDRMDRMDRGSHFSTSRHIQPSGFRLCHSVIKTFNVHADLDLKQ